MTPSAGDDGTAGERAGDPSAPGTPAGNTPAGDGQPAERKRAGQRPHRGWQLAAALLAAAAIAVGVYAGRKTLADSLHELVRLDWTWFLAAIGCELVSLSAFGLSRRRLLRADGQHAGFGSVMAITYASNALSMTIPFAGAELAVVFSYKQFRRRGLGRAITGWALAVSAIMSVSALALLLVAGSVAGGTSVATAIGFAGAALLLVPAAAILLALRSQRLRRLMSVALARLTVLARRVLRRPAPAGEHADVLESMLNRIASIRMRWPRYAEVFALALLNWVGDAACLAGAIHAAGQPVPWRGLLLAYAAGAAAGSTGLTPGGFALVEAALTAALVGVGMNSSGALTSVLAYRLVNFWMILIGGWITMIVLTRLKSRVIAPAQEP